MNQKVTPAAAVQRNQAIDIFRGATILLMVFYTVTGVLSDQLPYFAAHNLLNQFHPGDLILSMFIFASGMSLVFFEKKRAKLPAEAFRSIVLKRIGLLLAISLVFSPAILGTLFGMDEIMLNLLLFIPALYLVRLSDRWLVLLSLILIALHLSLFEAGMLPDYSKAYLGGYQGAIWWLPIMLGGVICARNQERVSPYLFLFGAAAIVLIYFCMPYKLNLYPSFIPLSIAWGFLFFELSKLIHSDLLVYCGRTPLRYWIFQMGLIVYPAKAYCLSHGRWWPVGVGGNEALLYGLLAVVLAVGSSKLYDLHKQVYRYLSEREAGAKRDPELKAV